MTEQLSNFLNVANITDKNFPKLHMIIPRKKRKLYRVCLILEALYKIIFDSDTQCVLQIQIKTKIMKKKHNLPGQSNVAEGVCLSSCVDVSDFVSEIPLYSKLI